MSEVTLPYKGRQVTMKEAAEISGLNVATMYSRAKTWGYIEEVITIPRGGKYRRGLVGLQKRLHPWRNGIL